MEGTPPTLFVTDLDGTLLDPAGHLSPWTRTTLGDLLNRGCPLTYCSARSHYTASRLLAGLPWHLPAIVSGGAFLVEPQDGQVLESRLLSAATAAAALETGRRLGMAPLLIGFVGDAERIYHLSPQNPGQAGVGGAVAVSVRSGPVSPALMVHDRQDQGGRYVCRRGVVCYQTRCPEAQCRRPLRSPTRCSGAGQRAHQRERCQHHADNGQQRKHDEDQDHPGDRLGQVPSTPGRPPPRSRCAPPRPAPRSLP